MSSKIAGAVIVLFVNTVLSADFPLTAVSFYSSLAPCAQSHLSVAFNSEIYGGCSSATPISAYGSCLCAQRLHSVNFHISNFFEFDAECSSTSVQPYLTAFCNRWGVDIAAAGAAATTTTTLAGGVPTSGATPGGIGNTGQAAPTSTSTSSGANPTNPSNGSNDNKITIIATVVGSVAGVIAAVIAYFTYRHMRKARRQSQQELGGNPHAYGGQPSAPSHPIETEHLQTPPQTHALNLSPYRGDFYGQQHNGGYFGQPSQRGYNY